MPLTGSQPAPNADAKAVVDTVPRPPSYLPANDPLPSAEPREALALPEARSTHDAPAAVPAMTVPSPAQDAPVARIKVQLADTTAGQPSGPVMPHASRPTPGEPVTASDRRAGDQSADQDDPGIAATPPPLLSPQAAATASPPPVSLEPTGTPVASTIAAPAADLVSGTQTPPSPVHQVASALLSVGTAPDGTQHLSLRLHPEELGTIDIRIERAPDGSARVSVTADNPETLQLMSSAQADLHKALDAAGVPSGRAVLFAMGGEVKPLAGLTDLSSRPIQDDAPSGQQSGGNAGSDSPTGQGSAAFSGGGTSADGGGSRNGGQSWPQFADAFRVAADAGAAADDSTLFQPEGI